MIAVLCATRRFDQLASALACHPLTLRDVQSCTFPSRPEPRRARWVAGEHDFLRYHYEPDLEVRLLWQQGNCTLIGHAAHTTLEDLLGRDDHEPWFELWSDLRRDLLGQAHHEAQRAAAAWRLRGELVSRRGESAQACVDVLVEGLEQGVDSARRACAEQLAKWPQITSRDALTRCRHDDPDVEVRMHAFSALEALAAQDLIRRA